MNEMILLFLVFVCCLYEFSIILKRVEYNKSNMKVKLFSRIHHFYDLDSQNSEKISLSLN